MVPGDGVVPADVEALRNLGRAVAVQALGWDAMEAMVLGGEDGEG